MIPYSLYKILTPTIKISQPGFFIFGHGVTDQPITNHLIQGLHMELNDFKEIIELWGKMGFRFLSMKEALEIVLDNKKVNYPWIHLTFDDGYKNNFTVVYPFLKTRNIPFTIFLSTRNIIENKRFDNYKIICGFVHSKNETEKNNLITNFKIPIKSGFENQIMQIASSYKYFSLELKEKFMERINNLLTDKEWQDFSSIYKSDDVLRVEEIKIMDKDPLVSFGSHGHNHYILSSLSEEQICYEQTESMIILQSILSKPITTYCYPNGKPWDYPNNIGQLTAKNNYLAGFTTVQKKIISPNPFEIPRFPLSKTFLPKLFVKLFI